MRFRNEGSKAGAFKIRWDKGLPIRIRPAEHLLDPGEHCLVQIDVDGGKVLGPIRYVLIHG